MSRFVLALGALALCAPPLPAQPPGPAPDPLAGIRVVEAKAEKGKIRWTEMKTVPVQQNVQVTVNVNGRNETQTRTVTVIQVVPLTREYDLSKVKVTDGAGKAVPADKVGELLKDATPVVLVTGTLPEKHRALFKEKTLFVEVPAPEPNKLVPAPAPAVPAPTKG
jgi:hypothetical protein